MEINILGKNSDDKGGQLEELTRSILHFLGYVNIATNEIGSGGNEIDVTAEFHQQMIGNVYKRLTICECKAHKAPINTTDWLKFLGKIFSHELGGKTADGCLIALNGANGPVKGQYRHLKELRNGVNLVTGEELYVHLKSIYKLLEIDEIQISISRKTKRTLLGTSVCFYDHHAYWLIYFTDGAYTLLANDGTHLEKKEVNLLIELISINLGVSEYIDLNEEKTLLDRILFVEKFIISIFLLDDQWLSRSEVFEKCGKKYGRFKNHTFDQLEIDKALISLIDKKVLTLNTEKYQLTVLTQIASQQDIIDMFKVFLEESIVILALGSPNYTKLIGRDLLTEICRIQGGISSPLEKIDDWIKVLQWSPSALRWALDPDPILVGHKKLGDLVANEVRETEIFYVSQKLSYFLSSDFGTQALHSYFHDICHIVELATYQTLKVKSSFGLLSELEFSERLRLVPYADEIGTIISIQLLSNQPEPWETVITDNTEELDIPT